ncbi:MAG: ABC transporter permease [Planctomycetia bacterium]|nr:ABC transporter permease [Planctomycetia bacterium]
MTPLFANRWLVAIPPIWLLGMGALVTLSVLAVIWTVLLLTAPRIAAEARTSLRDGFAGPLAWLLVTLAAVAIAFAPLVPIGQVWRSLVRMASADRATVSVDIPAGASLHEVPLDLRPQELASLELASDAPLVIRTQQPIEGFALSKVPDVDLDASNDNRWTWNRSKGDTNPFLGARAKLEATNAADKAVRLTATWRLVPEFPQAAILPWTVVTLLTLTILYGLFRLIPRRIAAVASATTKEAIGQPIFAVALIAGAVLLLAFIVIPYNTFGEDVKMLKDSGLTLIKVLALLVVVWTASVSVAEEIEGRTALTVLSKPLTRPQFILGKFAGLVLVALLVFLILGTVLLTTTSLKLVYDAREGAKLDPIWRDCADEMITVVPGLVLSLLETILLAAVSLAVSTRLGIVPNLIICFTVYALGHLVPLIVQSSVGKIAIVRFVGQLFATILPVLEHFTIEAAVVGGVPVPWSYLGWAALYAALYSCVALLVALVLFQDRDLA